MTLPVLLTTALLLPSTLSPAEAPALPSLLEVAEQAGTFSTLTAALDAAGLTSTLEGDEPLTVFAPTDEAFERLPKGTVEALLRPERLDDLVAILTYHVVRGRVSGADALRTGEARTLQGDALSFALEKGVLRVNDATVVTNDVPSRNGVIHVIDSVLLPPESAPEDPAREIIALAIDHGVPLFNNGQPAACAAVYEVAARALATLPCEALTTEAAEQLETGLEQAMAQRDPVDRAWTLRATLDTVSTSLAEPERTPRARTSAGDEKTLFDFSSAASAPWPSVNDDVMGGVSRGRCRITENGTALFAGALSLENNGGFSTIRSPERDLDLAGWDGLVLRVRGDGRTYNVSALLNDERRELNYWQRSFETIADEWIEVRVPFDDLAHRVMGWVRPDSPVDRGAIRSLSIGLSDKSTLPFALEVDWIRAYRES